MVEVICTAVTAALVDCGSIVEQVPCCIYDNVRCDDSAAIMGIVFGVLCFLALLTWSLDAIVNNRCALTISIAPAAWFSKMQERRQKFSWGSGAQLYFL